MKLHNYMRIFLLLGAGLFSAACGKVVEHQDLSPLTPRPKLAVRLCPPTGEDCYVAKWTSGPYAGPANSIEISSVAAGGAEKLRSSSFRVFAQMKCCGTIKEGHAHWEGDKLIIDSLALRKGEWLLVVETGDPANPQHAVGTVIVP